jgi:DNA-binding LacI/PurR family transcriptional regulator
MTCCRSGRSARSDDSGLKVPGDIGLIGLNDMEMAGWENINLTTIRQPISQIIDSSIELIVSMLENPERYPEARLFPCRVIDGARRGATTALSAGDCVATGGR